MPRGTDDSKPERHGQSWTDDEEKYVLTRVSKNTPLYTIADEVKRTSGGVYSHLKEVAYRNIKNGMLLEEASTLTSVPVSEIQDFITKKDLILKSKQERGLIQKKLQFPLEKKEEETLLSVAIEIRDLLKQLLNKQ